LVHSLLNICWISFALQRNFVYTYTFQHKTFISLYRSWKCLMLNVVVLQNFSCAYSRLNGSSIIRRKWGEMIYETPFRYGTGVEPPFRGMRRTMLLVWPQSCPWSMTGECKHVKFTCACVHKLSW
jgi:hypothetical protein